MHAQHLDHGFGVVVEAGERPHTRRGTGRRGIGVPGQQRRDGRGPRPSGVRVVRQALGHEQCAQVGVADAQLAERPCRLTDLLGRIIGVADDDLLSGEHDGHARLEALDVEFVVFIEEFEQIHGGQIAG